MAFLETLDTIQYNILDSISTERQENDLYTDDLKNIEITILLFV